MKVHSSAIGGSQGHYNMCAARVNSLRWLTVCAIALVCFMGLAGCSAEVKNSKANEVAAEVAARPSERETAADSPELNREVHNVVRAIWNRDPATLLAAISPNGLGLSSDPEPIALHELRSDLNRRGALYCLIFDNSCIKGKGNPCSLRDVLGPSKDLRFKISQYRYQTVDQAAVTIQPARREACGSDSLELIFNRNQNGRWMLVAIPYT